MDEWVIALITGGTAIAAGAVGGWFSRSAGLRQADAARHAADQQARALLDSVRITVRAEASQRLLGCRRQAYVDFLGEAEARILADRAGRDEHHDEALRRAFGAVSLEGPPPVAEAARNLLVCLRRHQRPDELDRAKLEFVTAAREHLAAGQEHPRPGGLGD